MINYDLELPSITEFSSCEQSRIYIIDFITKSRLIKCQFS